MFKAEARVGRKVKATLAAKLNKKSTPPRKPQFAKGTGMSTTSLLATSSQQLVQPVWPHSTACE